MFTTIKVTILTNARRADFWIWCLVFPIILATLFIFMFGSLKNSDTVMSVPVAVVKDASWEGSGFSQVVGALSGEGGEKDAGDGAAVATGASDGSLLDVHEVASIAEGEKLLDVGRSSASTPSTPTATRRLPSARAQAPPTARARRA